MCLNSRPSQIKMNVDGLFFSTHELGHEHSNNPVLTMQSKTILGNSRAKRIYECGSLNDCFDQSSSSSSEQLNCYMREK